MTQEVVMLGLIFGALVSILTALMQIRAAIDRMSRNKSSNHCDEDYDVFGSH